MSDPIAQLLLLARFFCFMAVFYLVLHGIAARLSRTTEGKVLWFFGTLTAPLTSPVRAWAMGELSDRQVLRRSLLFYLALWLCLIALGRVLELVR